ncbi:isochorismatase family protein [Paenarthrobacter sp. NPDC089714]|uniref:isochorismatase family protein n=1 Tax=unclassified Paenarthrobacter TaxID=2634190 RepID=UPI003804392D
MSQRLPASISYPLPTPGELPAPSLAWAAEPDRSALLIHDMQRHFLRPFDAGTEPINAVTANIQALRNQARELGIPVFYTAQPSHQDPQDRALLTDLWGQGIGTNEDGARIIDALTPEEGDTVLTKWRYSAYQRSDFAEQLAAAGRTQLAITGVYAHIGCQVTATDAFMQDVQPFFVADAVADFSQAHHQQALEWVAGRCGVVTTTADLHQAWGATAPTAGAAVNTAGLSAITAMLRGKVAELAYLDPEEIDPAENLGDLGVDSIRMMELVEFLRTAGYQVAYEQLAEEPTIKHWAFTLDAATAGATAGTFELAGAVK